MTTVNFLDAASEGVASAPGTATTIALSGATPNAAGGMLTWSGAGAQDGTTYSFEIIDGENREIATGVYNASSNSFTNRTTQIASVNGVEQATPINATAAAIISSYLSAADLTAGSNSTAGTLQSNINALAATVASDVTSLQAQMNALHSFMTRTVYTSSQTITIPGTIAVIRLVGGGGGAKATGNGTTSGLAGAGAGAYLEKTITGLTVGNTLVLTIGPGGTNSPTSGTASTLASGTQTISTLTAGGGGSADANSDTINGAGGTASGGDLNISGGSGGGGTSGGNQLGQQVTSSVNSSAAGNNYGGGAAASALSTAQSAAGAPGICIIDWYV